MRSSSAKAAKAAPEPKEAVRLTSGITELGKEVCYWTGEPGSFLDFDGESRWTLTRNVVHDVFADDYTAGKEWKMSEGGINVRIPGRVQADENLGSCKTVMYLRTEDEVFSYGGASMAAQVDWTPELMSSDIEVKGRRRSDGKGFVGFEYWKPCLHLFVPDRQYAKTHHIIEVILGAQVIGTLHTPGRGGGAEVANVTVRRQTTSFHLSLSTAGPELPVKKLDGFDLKQVSNYIRTVWLPQVQFQPQRWKVLSVKIGGTLEATVPANPSAPERKASDAGASLDAKLAPKKAVVVEKKPTGKQKGPKGELQTTIEAQCKKELTGSKVTIPNNAYAFFESKALISVANLETADERHQVVWTLRESAAVFQDAQLEPFFDWVVTTVLEHPDLILDWAEQCNKISRYEAEQEKTYVIIAWIAQDLFRQWKELPMGDRSFFEDAAPRLLKAKEWGSMDATELRTVLSGVRGRYVVIDRTMRSKEGKLALFFLRETPLQILQTQWSVEGATVGIQESCSFCDLYPGFIQYGDYEVSEDLVDRLVDGYMQVGASSPLQALQGLMSKHEVPAKVKRDFLMSFVSVVRYAEEGGGPRSAVKEAVVAPTASTAKGKKAPPASQSIPYETKQGEQMPKVELPHLDRLLSDWESRASFMTAADLTDIKEMFEAVLLLSVDDTLFEWGRNNVSRMRTFLDKVGSKYLSDAIRNAASAKDFAYDDKSAQKQITGKEKWKHDNHSSRYFSELQRSPLDCCQLLRMFVKLDLGVGGPTIGRFMHDLEKDSNCMATTLNKIAPEDSTLRAAICNELKRAKFVGAAIPIEYAQKLMNYMGFFEPALQNLIRKSDSEIEAAKAMLKPAEVLTILSAIVKLSSLKGTKTLETPESAFANIMKMCSYHALTGNLVCKVCEEVVSRKYEDFLRTPGVAGSGFDISNLVECTKRLGVASEVIDYKVKAGRITFSVEKLIDKVRQVVESFLKLAPNSWEDYFSSIDTIIFMLEYMGKEDLELAYDQFGKELEEAVTPETTTDEWTGILQLRELLESVKTIYTEALVKIDGDNIGRMQDMDISDFINRNAKRLGHEVHWCGVKFKPDDWNDILDIVGTTATAMQEKFNVLMLPHHTQMITLLMFAIRTCGVGKPTILPKTMLARVGTGEGKSWIIGMLAAFVAKKGLRKRRGLRAHVVIDNHTLKARDFDTVSRFFNKLGIKASKSEEHLLDPSYQVVYCTGAEIWSQCRKCQETGEIFEDLIRNAVLIVDEVDGLIIDGDCNIQYMYPDETLSRYADYWLRQLENQITPEPAVFDPNDGTTTDELKTILDKVEDAYEVANNAEKGKDFEWRGGNMYMINKSTGMLAIGWWDLWYEIRYWIDTEWAGSVTYKCIKSILCKKHCFTSYTCIFGLTGSLGQKAEKKYLTVHYDSIAFNVPYFLDTCRTGTGDVQGKPIMNRINSDDIVQPNEEEQITKVVDMAVAKCSEVPVLVIAKDQGVVETVSKRISEKLGVKFHNSEDSTLEADCKQRVIQLLEKPGEPERFVKLVDVATQPWADGQPAPDEAKKWRVTVTTAEGGRGHDYRVVDPSVDGKGGLLLILMWVSWSQREWIQFLGRTARQDHEGQVAVYLNAESDDLEELERAGKDLSKQDEVVDTILTAGNDKLMTKFNQMGNDISRGTLMHKLTSRYWKLYNSTERTSTKQESVWRRLCREYLRENMTEEALLTSFDKDFPPEEVIEYEDDNISIVDLDEGYEPGVVQLGEDSDDDRSRRVCDLVDILLCRCG